MHPEAYDAVGRMVADAEFETDLFAKEVGHAYADAVGYRAVQGLDIGGRDVNGSARDHFPLTVWAGLDIRPGPGVDIVEDATVWRADDPVWDFVLSTECLEHVENWRGIVACAASALRPDGYMLAFFTAASTGRGAHGASGEHVPPPGEWYGNVDPEDLRAAMSEHFEDVHVEYNPNPGDVYAWARGVR